MSNSTAHPGDPSPAIAEVIPGIDENSPVTKEVRQADLVISPILILLSLYFLYDSFRLSKKAIDAGQATVATSPGLFPFITCLLILACSVAVLVHAIRTRPSFSFLSLAAIKRRFSVFDSWTPILVLGMLAVYVFVFLNRMPFELATAIFIVAMMAVFRATRLWIAVTVAFGYSLAVAYCFTQWAATLLPKSIFL